MLVQRFATELQVLKLRRDCWPHVVFEVFEITLCVNAALSNATWQMLEQLVDFGLIQAWLDRVIIKG